MTECLQGAFSSGGGGGGATVETASETITSDFSSSSTTYTDITDWTLTKPDITDGKCITSAFCAFEGNTLNHNISLVMEDDGAIVSRIQGTIKAVNTTQPFGSISDVSNSDGTTIQMQTKISGGTLQIRSVADNTVPKLVSFGVG